MTKIAVVGGGFTGLACATSLIQNGVKVHLYEKQSYLGGLSAGFKDPQWNSSLEHYYHHWFKSDHYVSEYANIWGCSDGIKFHRPTTVMETQSNGFVQLDSPLSLLRYPELKFSERLRMGLSLAWIKSMSDWRKLDDVTAYEWCNKVMGENGFNAIWKPLLLGKFGEKYAPQVNMAWLWARLACRTPQLGTFEGGFSNYILRAATWLNAKGAEIETGVGEIKLELRKSRDFSKANTWILNDKEYDKVVFALGPKPFLAIAGEYAPQYTRHLHEKKSLGVQVVILSLKQKIGKPYWYSLIKTNTQPFLALIEHTNFVSSKEYNNENIIYCANYVDVQSEEWKWSDQDLLQKAMQCAQRINSKISSADLNRSWVFREQYAQPISGTGAYHSILPIQIEEAPGLFHASMSHVYPWDRGTHFALQLGKNTADLCLS